MRWTPECAKLDSSANSEIFANLISSIKVPATVVNGPRRRGLSS